MATSDKLTYLNTTKGLIKNAINNAGANITNDTFRSYATTLNTRITKMRSDRDKLLENSSIGTSTGSISNALDYPIYEDKMSKESTQETTTGKNKFDKENVDWYRNNQNIFIPVANSSTNRIRTTSFAIEGGKTYTLSGYPNSVTLNDVGAFDIEKNFLRYANASNNKFTLASDVAYIYLLFNGTNFTDATNELMKNADIQIEEGSSATDYEKYTGGIPAPSPSFPMEVKTVKGYRNLFDKTTIKTSKRIISTNGTENTNSEFFATDYIELKPNVTYHIKNLKTYGSGTYGLALYNNNKEYVNGYTYNSLNLIDKNDFNISFSDNFTYVRFSFVTETSDLDTAQIVEGDQELPYVPYGTNWIWNKVTGKNLFDEDKETDNYYYNASGEPTQGGTGNTYINIEHTPTSNKLDISFTQRVGDATIRICEYNGSTFITRTLVTSSQTLTLNSNTNKVIFSVDQRNDSYFENLMIVETNIVTIPLNGNEICGIGTYLDEPIVDKNGHCWLNKIIDKYIFNGEENLSYVNGCVYSNKVIEFSQPLYKLCNYYINGGVAINTSSAYSNGNNTISFNNDGSNFYIRNDDLTSLQLWKTWLSTKYTNNTPLNLYFVAETPQLIDLNYNVDITLFKGVNNITNSDDMDMAIKYVEDVEEIMSTLFTLPIQ